MSGLSDDENIIFETLKSGAQRTLDEIRAALGSDASRHSLIMRVKLLTAKLAPQGWIIERVSGIGAGAKAVYRMEKKF